jgi:Domain of unknown function (DUF1330)
MGSIARVFYTSGRGGVPAARNVNRRASWPSVDCLPSTDGTRVPQPSAAPATNPWLIAVSVMLAAFMEVLDTSVANVSPPHIAGGLAASNEESLWVLTSYGKFEVVEGSSKPTFPVILECPTLADAKRWYESKKYRPLKALRLACAPANGFLVQGVS